jgi:hypothetical protein
VSRGRLLLCPLVLVLIAALAGAAGAARDRQAAATSISFGITDDAMKYAEDGGGSLFADLNDLGMSDNRINVFWDENTPTKILEEDFVDRMMPVAAQYGIRVEMAIQPIHALAFATNTAAKIAAFTNYVREVARRWPQVKEFVIGNEPNVKRFWQPQHNPDGSISSAAVYEQVLAASYDTLKAIDPSITVDGLALSPRGNDGPPRTNAEGVSPVRFIAALGAAYRQSGRTKPIADVFDFHAYSNMNTQPLTRPYQWPNAGAANLDRLEQAWWDAFHGTGQPVFREAGQTGPGPYVTFRIDESGTQVKIDPTKVNPDLYSGTENVPTVDEATQAQYYTGLISLVKCDSSVSTLDLFHLIDEPLLNSGFQSGLLRIDGSKRPSYAAVKQAIAAARTCAKPHAWKHTTAVIGAKGSFNVTTKVAAQRTWRSTAGAGEEVVATTSIFPASGASARSLLRAALGNGATGIASMPPASGQIKANTSRTFTLRGKLPPGRYVYAALLHATMNPARTSLLVSKAFTVR